MNQQKYENNYRLGDLQLKIMKALWQHGGCSVAEVHQHLAGDQLAYTTVATMLRKMEDRGLVRHTEQERRFIYRSAVSESEVTSSMSNHFLERLFEGSLSSAVSHLLETRDVSPEELAELERLIRRRSRQR